MVSKSTAQTRSNFATTNRSDYRAVGVWVKNFTPCIIFESYDRNFITEATITNVSGTLTGTVVITRGYDSDNPKDFHVTELNQRTLMSWLNDDYKSKLFVKGKSTTIATQYDGTVEDLERDSLDEVILCSDNKTLYAHKKVLQYTGDSFAAVTDNDNNIDYDANNHVQLGWLKSTKPQLALRLDDSLISQYTLWYPWFTARGWNKVTLSANTGFIEDGTPEDVMTYAQVKELQDAGWEINNHSDSIDNAQYWTPDNAIANITDCETKLLAAGIVQKGLNVITPHNYTGLNQSVKRWIIRNRRAMWYVRVPRTEELTEYEVIDKSLLNSMITDAASTVYDLSTDAGLNLLKAQIDIAAANNRICSWFCHAYSAAIVDRYEDAVEYALAQGLTMVTYSEALDNCKYLPLD